ncbi:MAG TPA: pyruvate dehydrogenase (acetyl-transferring) E1 component subunit alpha [Polyangiaceae bacterium]|jgi:pyruvate dehydrogenase E1 component subunit alpha|nr:pyruvate dehydrogenase (acetyl-transferring) E1 component subunit alpha [Polyangiaceae bacterium]
MNEPDTAVELYRQMQLIRRFEEESARAYSLGKVGGFLHLYIGQEAVAVGTSAALRPDDYTVTTYRDHGLALARGMSARAAMAELYGKATGCSKGLGGSMHFFDVEHYMFGGHGIVGAHLPLAAGVAFAAKYRGEDRVTVVFYGEGAASIGATHEGMSLAALWKLPVVFVCENNEYAMGTHLDRHLSVTDVSKKADAYGMPKDRFAADDVFTVRDRVAPAIERARRGEGPTLIEIRTYRYRGHSMSDPAKYRTSEELEGHKKRDALERLRKQLLDNAFTKQRVAEVDAHVEDTIADAISFAEDSPEPGPEILEPTTYVGAFAR